MKSIILNWRMALAAVMAACFLILPAVSMPMGRGMGIEMDMGMHGLGTMTYALNNVTPEEMGNMTLGEIKEMAQDAWNASISSEAGDGVRNSSPEECGRISFGGRMQGAGSQCMAYGDQCIAYGGQSHGLFAGYGIFDSNSAAFLLMDDITVEQLGEMSLNDILDLQDELVQEMESMTLNEIRGLWQEKILAQNNMTINELANKSRDTQAVNGIMSWVSTQYRQIQAWQE